MTNRQEHRVFISYSRKDVDQVNELYMRLKRHGFSPWQDHRDIIAGTDWFSNIIKAIKHSFIFLACLSNNSVNKQTGVLVREINEALEEANNRRKGSIFILPVRLEECCVPEEFSNIQWVDMFEADGFDRLVRSLKFQLKKLGIDSPLGLRSEPRDDLSPAEAGQMIRERNFYCQSYWRLGLGIQHEYEVCTIDSDKIVVDQTTGLIWQQSCSGYFEHLDNSALKQYINNLNTNKFAGFNNWRLPTLEEAMSLAERENKNNTGHIDTVFADTTSWMRTADRYYSDTWWVRFINSECICNLSVRHRVRAVRSG